MPPTTGPPTRTPTFAPSVAPSVPPTPCDPLCTWQYAQATSHLKLLHKKAMDMHAYDEELHLAHRSALQAMEQGKAQPQHNAEQPDGHSTTTVVMTTLVTVVGSVFLGMALEGWRSTHLFPTAH